MTSQDQRLQAIRDVTADYYRKVRFGILLAVVSLIPVIIKTILIYNDHASTTERFLDQIMGLFVLGLLAMSMWVTYSLIKIEEIRNITRESR